MTLMFNTIKEKDLNSKVKGILEGGKYNSCSLKWGDEMPVNIPFNKTLYMVEDGKLIAFMILLASQVGSEHGKDFEYGWNYYIITPNGPKWSTRVDYTILFHSKEEYFQYLESGVGGFRMKKNHIGSLLSKSLIGNNEYYETWVWDGIEAKRNLSYIRNLIIDSSGVSIVIGKRKYEYWSKEECLKANLDGMEIIEFPDEKCVIDIKVEVPQHTPKTHVLKFVEE